MESQTQTTESQTLESQSSMRSTQSLKRKASTDTEVNKTQGPSKKAKDAPSDSKQPNNMTIPAVINFAPPTPNTVKIASWNVAGLRASLKKVIPSLL